MTLFLALGSALQAGTPAVPSDKSMTLAACQARYTAALEHAWLMQGDTEAAAMRRDLFAAMLAAMTRTDPDRFDIERQLLIYRISQKHAASSLFSTARFDTDPRRARIALGIARQQLAACNRLLIARVLQPA